MRSGRNEPIGPASDAGRPRTASGQGRRRPTVAAVLALVVLLPAAGAGVLAGVYAASSWSDHRDWAQIQPAGLASQRLTQLYADEVSEGTATVAVATAHDLGVSVSTLDKLIGIDFEDNMLQARRAFDANPTLHAYPQLAEDIARLEQLRSDVDANHSGAAAAVAVFSALSADINRLWLARLDDIRGDANRIGSSTGILDAQVDVLRLTHLALSASIDLSQYANNVLRGQNSRTNVTALIDANSRYDGALSDISGRYGPKVAAAWKTLQTDPATARFQSVIAQAVAVGLTGASSPLASDLKAYGAAFGDAVAWQGDVTALAAAASTDVTDLAARQGATATREFLAALAAALGVLVVAVGGSALAARSISRPLRRLSTAAAEITGGQFVGPEIPVGGPREVAQTSEAVNNMRSTLVAVESLTAALARDPGPVGSDQPPPFRTDQPLEAGTDKLRYSITAAEQQWARMLEIATHDPLSGLLNRNGAVDAIRRDLARAERDHIPVTVLFMDLDELKHINDTYGHAAGDRAIKAAAGTLRATTRGADIVARLGGDEFLVSTSNQTPGEAEALAERVLEAVRERTISVDGAAIPLACSIGVAHVQPDDTVESLIHHADQALYAAKQNGRDQVAVYHAEEVPAARVPVSSALPGSSGRMASRRARPYMLRPTGNPGSPEEDLDSRRP